MSAQREYEHGGYFRCGRLAWGRAERTLHFVAAEHGVRVRINSADGLLFLNSGGTQRDGDAIIPCERGCVGTAPKSTKADLVAALHAILTVPQAYHNRGAQFVADEMENRVRLALADQFAGLGRTDRIGPVGREEEGTTHGG